MKKVVAICGDSWFSSDTDFPEKSFGEILCAKNDWQLLSLARGGCSNFAIALQVDKAIEINADFVIVGTTTPDRGEFPIINEHTISFWEKLKKSFDWKNWFDIQPETYVKTKGISNILHDESLSSNHPWISSPTIISESLNNLAFGASKLTTEQIVALKHYMLNLYDVGIKRQIDCWIISDACRRLEHANIPYLIFIESLYQWDFSQDISWVPEINVVRPKDFSVWNDVPMPKFDTPFHYCSNTGGTVVANYLESRIKKLMKQLVNKDNT